MIVEIRVEIDNRGEVNGLAKKKGSAPKKKMEPVVTKGKPSKKKSAKKKK